MASKLFPRETPQVDMNIDYDIEYRLIDSQQYFLAQCTSLSGANISFLSDKPVAEGKGLEIHVQTNNPANPSMTAYIETIRCIKRKKEQSHEISALIKSVKGN